MYCTTMGLSMLLIQVWAGKMAVWGQSNEKVSPKTNDKTGYTK